MASFKTAAIVTLLSSAASAAPAYGPPSASNGAWSSAAPVSSYTQDVGPYSDYPQQPSMLSTQWAAGAVTEYPIHYSCNGTQEALLRQALWEAEVLAGHGRDHIMRFGNDSSMYRKYFGDAPTGEPAGWLDKIVNSDKAGVLFRCDDIDGNCAHNLDYPGGYNGHWRGENGSDESVICELSYYSKKPLAGMCAYGYSVASHPTTFYFGSDLMHRLYHTDKIGEGVVGHYADEYEECLQLAIDSPEEAVRNSATLRYFALDVYAYDIAVPGAGCTGEPVEEEEEESSSTSSSSMMTSTSSAEAAAATSAEATTTEEVEMVTSTEGVAAPATVSASADCHTHSDGDVHCVAATTSATAEAVETEAATTSIPANCHTHEGGELHCETPAATAAAAEETVATTTSSAPANCHTHEGGELHCT